MYEQSSGRRGLGPAFIIIVVLIAAAAGTMAYVIAGRFVDGSGTNQASRGPSSSTAPSGEGSSTPRSSASATPKTTPQPGAKACPKLTEQGAVAKGSPGGLKQLLYVRTANSEAWICADRDGNLWYQGHSPRTVAFTAATSDVTILLDDVTVSGDGYAAVNRTSSGTTTYRVSRTVLRVDQPPISEPVIYAEG